jgi:hypothetical protein
VILPGVDVGTQRTIEDRATELAVAVAARDLASVRVLTDPDHWERSAAEDYEQVLPHVRHVEILGALFRRSLMLIEAPGWEVSRIVFEHLWDQREPPLLADQRLFTLVDRAEIERAGYADKLARLRTKLEAQDAAAQLVDALSAHDAAAAAEAFDQTLARWDEHDARLPIESIRTAELLGSVGPRTLVRIQGESDQTIEYLWRRAGDGMLVAGARVFERS